MDSNEAKSFSKNQVYKWRRVRLGTSTITLSTINAEAHLSLGCNVMQAPQSLFLFHSFRDDAKDVHFNDRGTIMDRVKGFSKGTTGRISGFKLYQKKMRFTDPGYLVSTKIPDDLVTGRIVEFKNDTDFKAALQWVTDYYDKYANKDCKIGQVTVEVEFSEGTKNAITFILENPDLSRNLDGALFIESGDWLKRSVFATEKRQSNNNGNRIHSTKGRLRFESTLCRRRRGRGRRRLRQWSTGMDYKKGDITFINTSQHGRWGCVNANDSKLWAMCMVPHKSTAQNTISEGQIFSDLAIGISTEIRQCLFQIVGGFADQITEIVVSYSIPMNDYWWLGCPTTKSEKHGCTTFERCGNLTAGIRSTEFCRMCFAAQTEKEDGDWKDSPPIKMPNKGTVIRRSKDDNSLVRTYEDTKENTDNDDADDAIQQYTKREKSMILRTDIDSEGEREKIYKLMVRNFGEGMEPLIRACVDGKEQFTYKIDDKEIAVNIGETKIWALYSSADDELLCALIWRFVHGETVVVNKTRLMFEVLFLSTSEHVRFNHYGQEMVRHIELYCRANMYDLIEVAAVPVHGVAFWTSNGFKEEHSAPREDSNDQDDKQKRDVWLNQNMLVFDDTPLYVKYLYEFR